MRLINLIKPPSVSLILGKRRAGKTAFMMRVLEEAYRLLGMKAYVLGIPEEKRGLLPEFITLVDSIDDLPDNVAIGYDEAYLDAMARDHPRSYNKHLAKSISVSAQKAWLLMFSTHTARKFDVLSVLDCDIIVVRKPSWLYTQYERREIRDIIEQADKLFKKKEYVNEYQKWAYIASEKPPVFVEVPLPSFWTEGLSKAFSGVSLKKIGKGEEQEE